MDLHDFFVQEFPGLIFYHKSGNLNELLVCKTFRLHHFTAPRFCSIDYISVANPGDKYGDVVISAIISYCRLTQRQLFISSPQKTYHRFWRRNGFSPDQQEDTRWKYQPI